VLQRPRIRDRLGVRDLDVALDENERRDVLSEGAAT